MIIFNFWADFDDFFIFGHILMIFLIFGSILMNFLIFWTQALEFNDDFSFLGRFWWFFHFWVDFDDFPQIFPAAIRWWDGPAQWYFRFWWKNFKILIRYHFGYFWLCQMWGKVEFLTILWFRYRIIVLEHQVSGLKIQFLSKNQLFYLIRLF